MRSFQRLRIPRVLLSIAGVFVSPRGAPNEADRWDVEESDEYDWYALSQTKPTLIEIILDIWG